MSNKTFSVDRTLRQARTLAKKGDRAQASQLYLAVLELFPKNRRAIEGLKLLEKPTRGLENPGLNTGPSQEQLSQFLDMFNRGQFPEALEQGTRLFERYPTNPIILNILGAVYAGMDRMEDAVASYKKALRLKPDYVDAYNNFGVLLKDLGRYEEAISSYTKALRFKPDYVEAHYNLGNIFYGQGRFDEAIAGFTKALELDPGHEQARHLLDALLERTTTSPPRKYVTKLFGQYADSFDDDLKGRLGYDAPSMIEGLLNQESRDRQTFNNAVDLGCGTGLCGVEVRDHVKKLTGVDLSVDMIKKAEEKNVYDRLVVGDLVQTLDTFTDSFDLFISMDVFIYVGELSPLFRSARRVSSEDALFVLSTEHQTTGGYTLLKSGRYSHSKAYIDELAITSGWTVRHFEEFNLRKQEREWLTGGLYLLKASNS